jgi:D-alanine-D-alanine ligase
VTDRLRTVLVLYNTDYDEELKEASGADVSAVQDSAAALERAVGEAGYDSALLGVHGDDLDRLFRRLVDEPPDLVFNLVESLRGTTRNEPLVPAMLEMLEIPFTGPGPLSLRLCLDKHRSRQVLAAAGVSIPEGRVLRAAADLDDPAINELAYPYFVKLSREDASIGIDASNVVESPAALRRRAGELLAAYRQPVIAERYVRGREVNVSVMGNGEESETLPLYEIDFAAMPAGRPHIISYAAKWDESHPDYTGTLPVPLRDPDPDLAAAIRATAVAAFRALEVADFGRVDLRIDETGAHVIDVNPNCDLSPGAGLARAAAAAGKPYPALIGSICEIAWRRQRGGAA